MRQFLLLALLGLVAAACEYSNKMGETGVKNSPAHNQYAVIDVDECVEASSLDATNAKISDRLYAKPSLSAASILGVSKSGDCIVIAKVSRPEEQNCFIDMRIRVKETESKIIVRRETRRRLTPVEKGACSLDLTVDPVAIRLDEPVGDREIVDAITL